MVAILKNIHHLVRVQYVCIISHIEVAEEGLQSTFRPYNYYNISCQVSKNRSFGESKGNNRAMYFDITWRKTSDLPRYYFSFKFPI